MPDGGRAGTSSAAKQRRERRLRAAWRHEQLSVRMALAAAQHHSAPKCAGPETDEVLRGLTTARAAGTRPAGTVTVGYVAAPGPLLVVASLAGRDEVDATTVSFLLRENLRQRQMEEEERRMEEMEQAKKEMEDEEWHVQPAASSSSRPTRRRKKKRKKKKTPKTSSSGGRPHRRQRQWHVHRWFSWFCSSRCVPSFCRHAQVARNLGRTVFSVLCMAGVAGYRALALCSLLLSERPLGHVVLARRCATTGAGFGPDSLLRCPWRLHRCSSWTRLWSLRQVPWSRQCKPSGGAAVAAHLQGR